MRLLLVAAALLVHSSAIRRRHFVQHTHNLTIEGIQLDKYVTVDSATGIHYNPISKQHPGRRVCSKEVIHPIKLTQVYCKPTYKKYQEKCNNNQICTGTRLIYETTYRDLTKHSKRLTYACCPGWTQVNTKTYGCNKPLCSKPCQNGGNCTRQDICDCPKGFTGRYCELDIDECKEYKPCDQICENTSGSYKCYCRERFTLQSDGQSCHAKPLCLNPCKNGGNCTKQDICDCPNGFTGRYCELDIDECKEYKPCDQICENTSGSYKCHCRERFTLQSDGQSCHAKQEEDTAIEATDLVFSLFNRRMTTLENEFNEVSQKEIPNIKNNIATINRDITSIKLKLQNSVDVEIFKNTLKRIEKSANKAEEFMKKFDKYRKFY